MHVNCCGKKKKPKQPTTKIQPCASRFWTQTSQSSVPAQNTRLAFCAISCEQVFYLCLKGSCISFRLWNIRGLVLKSKTTVVEYRAWSPGEFRTLKTCLVFVLKGLDSILLNKSYNCSFCFMLFFLLQELDMNEGDLRVCLYAFWSKAMRGLAHPSWNGPD